MDVETCISYYLTSIFLFQKGILGMVMFPIEHVDDENDDDGD